MDHKHIFNEQANETELFEGESKCQCIVNNKLSKTDCYGIKNTPFYKRHNYILQAFLFFVHLVQSA